MVKRTADAAVNMGTTVDDADSFIQVVSSRTKVKMFLVTEDQVTTKHECLEKIELKPISGTMKLHQLQTVQPGVLSVRDLSWFCSHPHVCN